MTFEEMKSNYDHFWEYLFLCMNEGKKLSLEERSEVTQFSRMMLWYMDNLECNAEKISFWANKYKPLKDLREMVW